MDFRFEQAGHLQLGFFPEHLPLQAFISPPHFPFPQVQPLQSGPNGPLQRRKPSPLDGHLQSGPQMHFPPQTSLPPQLHFA